MTYFKAQTIIGNRDSKKIGNNTYLIRRPEGFAIRLHDTDILLFRPDHSVVVRTNGWQTVTTKARLNEYLDGGVGICQRNYTWYWHLPGVCPTTVEFQEGDIVLPDGRVTRADGQSVI